MVDPQLKIIEMGSPKVLEGLENSNKEPMIADATNCKGWNCSIEGQFCPTGAPGASAGNFICKNKKWVKISERPATGDDDSATNTNGRALLQSIADNELSTLNDLETKFDNKLSQYKKCLSRLFNRLDK